MNIRAVMILSIFAMLITYKTRAFLNLLADNYPSNLLCFVTDGNIRYENMKNDIVLVNPPRTL